MLLKNLKILITFASGITTRKTGTQKSWKRSFNQQQKICSGSRLWRRLLRWTSQLLYSMLLTCWKCPLDVSALPTGDVGPEDPFHKVLLTCRKCPLDVSALPAVEAGYEYAFLENAFDLQERSARCLCLTCRGCPPWRSLTRWALKWCCSLARNVR